MQDDNITNDMGQASAIFQRFQELRLPWATPQGIALWRMDESLLELMAAAGAYQVTFAIESGVQRVLDDLIRKPLNLEKTQHLIRHAVSLGLDVHGFFIVGMPPMFGHSGETVAEMHASYAFAERSGLTSASFFAATPIVGSVLLSESIRQGFIANDVELYRMSYKQGLISVPGLWQAEEIADLAASFNVRFNSTRPKKRVSRQWTPERY